MAQHGFTKSQLYSILTTNGTARISFQLKSNGLWVNGILQSIARESGNGSCFILKILGNDNKTIRDYYVRTVD